MFILNEFYLKFKIERMDRMDVDDTGLTPEQSEILSHFQELSGIDDLDRCKNILSLHGWDIEMAIQSVFNEEEGIQPLFPDVPVEPPGDRIPPVNVNSINQEIVSADSSASRRGVTGWISFIALQPFYLILAFVLSFFRLLKSFVTPDPRLLVTDPHGDVMSFIQSYQAKYPTSTLNFYQGTYSKALNEAKRSLQFMVVYLHNDVALETAAYCRTLCDPLVVNLLNSRTILWGCNVNSPEGYRVTQALKVHRFPFLGVISLRRNGQMTVIARILGLHGPNEIVKRLTKILDDNESELIAARLEREELNLNQTLRAQQDVAYMESLLADQEKERQKREKIDHERTQLLNEQRKQELLEERKAELRKQIPDEPGQDVPNTVKILLKLPNGVRIERRFLRTDSLEVLYNYVFVHEAAPDDFQIVTNFPRRVVPCQKSSDNLVPPTFEQFGLEKAEMLFVSDNQA